MISNFVQCLGILWIIDFWAWFGTYSIFSIFAGCEHASRGEEILPKTSWSSVFQHTEFWCVHLDCSDDAETLRFCSTIEYLKMVDYELKCFTLSARIGGWFFPTSDPEISESNYNRLPVGSWNCSINVSWNESVPTGARGFATPLHSMKSFLFVMWSTPPKLLGSGRWRPLSCHSVESKIFSLDFEVCSPPPVPR